MAEALAHSSRGDPGGREARRRRRRGGFGGAPCCPPDLKGARGSAQEPVRRTRLRAGLNELTGALADLGVFVPLAAALIVVNGLDPASVFIGAGLLVIASGLVFRVPFPVQPLKALTAVAVANELSPDVVHAAGFEIAIFLLILSAGRVADLIARAFTPAVIRALQFGVGLLLLRSAFSLVISPPPVFRGTPPSPWPIVLATAAGLGLARAARRGRYGFALVVLAGGTAAAWFAASPALHGPSLGLPGLGLPPVSAFATAFVLLVVPQLPLTFGNAVVAVTDVARRSFGPRSQRVTPSRVCLSAGVGNAAAALLGGMPMCHGSGGLTAHIALGARTAVMNVTLGASFLVLGVFFAPQLTVLLGLLPAWGLGAFLAYAGVRHARLVGDLHGMERVVAAAAGAVGALTGNLAITLGIALGAEHAARRLLVRAA